MCAAALGDPDARTQFWTHVLDPPVTSFKQLMASETFTKQYQQEDMKKQVLYHIDNFIGKKCAVFLFPIGVLHLFRRHEAFLLSLLPHYGSTSRKMKKLAILLLDNFVCDKCTILIFHAFK